MICWLIGWRVSLLWAWVNLCMGLCHDHWNKIFWSNPELRIPRLWLREEQLLPPRVSQSYLKWPLSQTFQFHQLCPEYFTKAWSDSMDSSQKMLVKLTKPGGRINLTLIFNLMRSITDLFLPVDDLSKKMFTQLFQNHWRVSCWSRLLWRIVTSKSRTWRWLKAKVFPSSPELNPSPTSPFLIR